MEEKRAKDFCFHNKPYKKHFTLKFMAIHRLDQNNFLIFKIFTFLIKRGS